MLDKLQIFFLKKACKICLEKNKTQQNKRGPKGGGQVALAKEISIVTGKKIKQQNIWWWVNKSHAVPAIYAPIIEKITNKLVLKSDLRPDIWPPK